jgi:hypothetical protein
MDTALRAQRAKALLEDPLFKEAFDVVENEQISLFTEQVCSAEQLMEAHRMVRALRLLKDQLTSYIVDGKLLERRNEKGQHRV